MLIPQTQPSAPLESVSYLVVAGEQNVNILNEFFHSLASLRRFHPDIPVMVYHDNLEREHLEMIADQPNVMTFAIGVDRSGRFVPNNYKAKYGWKFPELHVLSCKLDCLLLTPGNNLFLDTDTEVLQPLDQIFASNEVWMHKDEGLLIEQERDFKGNVLNTINWDAWAWRCDRNQIRMYNSGTLFIPQAMKVHLYKAKEFMWTLAMLPADDRGDNRLDEQLAISIALQEATNYNIRVAEDLVEHYWLEKYEAPTQRYLQYV